MNRIAIRCLIFIIKKEHKVQKRKRTSSKINSPIMNHASENISIRTQIEIRTNLLKNQKAKAIILAKFKNEIEFKFYLTLKNLNTK